MAYCPVGVAYTHKCCLGAWLAEFEPSTRLDGIGQFLPHCLLVLEHWQLEEIHAGRGRGQVAVPNARGNLEGGVELLESQQRGTTAARHELEQLALLFLSEATHHIPEQGNAVMVRIVVTWGDRERVKLCSPNKDP